jgi:hypothetical protein
MTAALKFNALIFFNCPLYKGPLKKEGRLVLALVSY